MVYGMVAMMGVGMFVRKRWGEKVDETKEGGSDGDYIEMHSGKGVVV
jgi:hypothetical protein